MGFALLAVRWFVRVKAGGELLFSSAMPYKSPAGSFVGGLGVMLFGRLPACPQEEDESLGVGFVAGGDGFGVGWIADWVCLTWQ